VHAGREKILPEMQRGRVCRNSESRREKREKRERVGTQRGRENERCERVSRNLH